MIRKLKDARVTNKRVLLRADLNLTRDLKGKIIDDFRLRAILPTIKYLTAKKAKTIIISHLGDPGGKHDSKLSLKPVARILTRYLKKPAVFIPELISDRVRRAISMLKPGGILMLENLRFDEREEESAPSLAKQLAGFADIYVNDAFGVSHRNHASVSVITRFIPSYIGPVFEKEIKTLDKIRINQKPPFIAIIGGVKLATKLALLKYFQKKASKILIGGALANNFFVAKGFEVGRSFYEPILVGDARKLLKSDKFILPKDLVVAKNKDGGGPVRIILPDRVGKDEYIYDFGPKTIKDFIFHIKKAKTLLWNGPLGLDEIPKFRKSTNAIAKTIAASKGFTVVGGGDTVAVLDRLRLRDKIDYVSTGGGAMLEYLGRGTLLGLEALARNTASLKPKT